MADKTLTCSDCSMEFAFTEREQDFYAEKGFRSLAGAPRAAQAARPRARVVTADTVAARTRAATTPGTAEAAAIPPADTAVAVAVASAAEAAGRARCSARPAPAAARRLASRSGQPTASPCTARIASARFAAAEERPSDRVAGFRGPVLALTRDHPLLVARAPTRQRCCSGLAATLTGGTRRAEQGIGGLGFRARIGACGERQATPPPTRSIATRPSSSRSRSASGSPGPEPAAGDAGPAPGDP